MAGALNEQLRWVGALMVLGLVLTLAFVGYRTWDRLGHGPPSVSTLPSAGAKADAAPGPAVASPHTEPPPLPVENTPTEQAAPGTHEHSRVALGGGPSSSTAPQNLGHPFRLCEFVVDGLRMLRPCAGAPSKTGQHPKCLVTNVDGVSLLRDCKGIPGERPAPSTGAR